MNPTSRAPRFSLRTLLVLIAFLALLSAIGVLTRENIRLRQQAAIERDLATAVLVRAEAAAAIARANELRARAAIERATDPAVSDRGQTPSTNSGKPPQNANASASTPTAK